MVVWRGPTKKLRRGKRKAKEKRKDIPIWLQFKRIARKNKKAFLHDQCKEIEENSRMGKTRHLFKKIRGTKGTFHAKMGFRYRVMLFIWLFSCFLWYAINAMNFPLSTAFTVFHRFGVLCFIYIRFYAYFDFFCDLFIIQQHIVQLPYADILNSVSPAIEM